MVIGKKRCVNNDRYRRVELTLYAVVWFIILMSPILVQLYLLAKDPMVTRFEWSHVIFTWIGILPFFILFIVHDRLLMPLIMKRRIGLYVTSTLIAVFLTVWIPHELHGLRDKPDTPKREHKHRRPHRVLFFYITNSIFCLMTVSGNMASRLYFSSMANARRMEDMEAERLASELQYLKYQINPHFMMNTLNNIHALIDIDPAKAQRTVVELSKLMRYLLYDVDRQNVRLDDEIKFINNYIELMKIRLSGNVEITFNHPDDVKRVMVPPLIFISYVENAFKHGVSLREPSFIDIGLEIDDSRVIFNCINSRRPRKETGERHGIGLENVHKRLDLLFASDYTLDISESDKTYIVNLSIPYTYQS